MGETGGNDSPRLAKRFYTVRNLDRAVTLARRIHLAGTSAERRRGLLGVWEMDPEAGLWIDPCEAIHTFGMKMPIDVIFLDCERRIRKISTAVGPNRIALCFVASSVLELAAGTVLNSGTQPNDHLEFI